MSTKIRPIKCPNCGSEKHLQLDEKRYRCKNCGTEYFLDDDDININVKHQFDYGGFTRTKGDSDISTINVIKVFAIIGGSLFFLFMLLFFSIDSSKSSASYKDSISVDDSYKAIVPVKYNGRVCFFYLTDRSFSNWYSDDETPPSGYY